MDVDSIMTFAIPAFFVAVVAYVLIANARAARRTRMDKERNEALFRTMFPDLQPHFHPEKLLEFVKARRAQRPGAAGRVWKNPPGFAAADAADIKFDNGRERVRLLDAAGAMLAQFFFEEHAEGGVLRMGKGKFTVNTREAVPRVRYWHPDREFKWSRSKGWTFTTRMADDSFSSSSGSSDSSSSSSSSSSTTAAVAGAAGAAAVMGAGGAFDGGGASQGWDGASATTSY